MEKTWIVDEFEDLNDPFSFFRNRKPFTLTSKKALAENI